MRGISLTKAEYDFLRLGLGRNDSHAGKLAMFLCDGEGMVLTTNGWSLHAIHTEGADTRGYYLWNSAAEMLMMVDSKNIDPPDLIKSALDVRRRNLDEMLFDEPMDIVSFQMGNAQFGLHLDQPAGKRTCVGFRKGMHKGKLCAICIGSNFAPLEWNEDGSGETREVNWEEYLMLDMKLLIGVMKHIGNGKMIWRDSRSPAIIGNKDGWHAILMPLKLGGLPGWK